MHRQFIGPRRYRINAQSLDYWRSTKRYYGGTVLSPADVTYFGIRSSYKEKTVTQLAYLAKIANREKNRWWT